MSLYHSAVYHDIAPQGNEWGWKEFNRHSSKNYIYIHIYKLEITNRVFTKYYWSLGASKHIVAQMVYETNIRNITIARILSILIHYDDVITGAIASQITTLTIVYSAVYSGANQRKHQRSASLAFVRGIHRWPVNSPHKWPVTRKMFSFDDVILHQPFLYIREGQLWWVRIGGSNPQGRNFQHLCYQFWLSIIFLMIKLTTCCRWVLLRVFPLSRLTNFIHMLHGDFIIIVALIRLPHRPWKYHW